jgi:hypothetical protein
MNRKIPSERPDIYRQEAVRVANGARKREQGRRMWIFFSLICLVALLWSAFLYARQEWVWVSLLLFIMVIGINVLLLLFRFMRQ